MCPLDRWILTPILMTGLFLSLADDVFAKKRTFPYEAVVNADEALVRSGNGRRYYPTLKLKRGNRVTVHRHDPGGWFMIAPPQGSFSWVRAEHVQKLNGNRGRVTENGVVVRVGSAFDESREVEQIRLSKNDEITILDSKNVQTEFGNVLMYRIKPPVGEWRWVEGHLLLPTDEYQPGKSAPAIIDSPIAQNDADPFSQGMPEIKTPAAPNREQIQTPTDGSARRSVPQVDEIAAAKDAIKTIDTQFRAMIEAEPTSWDLDGLEQDYKTLQQEIKLPAIASKIDLRIDAVNRYRKVKEEYKDFLKLAEETSKRDAELVSMAPDQNKTNRYPSPEVPVGENGLLPPTPEPAPADSMIPGQPAAPTQPVIPSQPTPPLPQPSAPTPTVPQPQMQQPSQPAQPQFSGAGIVRRLSNISRGMPTHALVAPDGRFLAYLQPVSPQINLDAVQGRAIGVTGKRWFRNDLRGEYILVESMTPVRLQAAPVPGR
ncbi:hypothetical protein [Gimesia chilikensis]|uniref:hypothetical protein n=1 Tax=Gimesia chilikensis TaxID=2605989 RepID=UPI00118A1CD2|nr:hypothetical protein [Gimesia chilikensis]QDT82984.1 hypothetical protein MalM14_06150 [Gimesia chilikensis]